MKLFGRVRLLAGASFVLVLLSLTPVEASSASISRSYQATGQIKNGSLLSLSKSQSDYVELANSENGDRLIGVAVAENESLLAVGTEGGTIQVATSGIATALVSTLNGPIKVGDKVAVSPFNGVGMKAAAGAHYIGLAQTDFNSSSSGASQQQIRDKSGKTQSVYAGYARVNIDIGVNNTGQGDNPASFLQKLGHSLTGRSISNFRIALSLAVAIVALVVLIMLIYGAIYGSIISIGRNPLAKHAIFRSLGSVFGMVIATCATAGTIIYFLLR